jgi:uncharacterized repeat protein (TIGR01451 family)
MIVGRAHRVPLSAFLLIGLSALLLAGPLVVGVARAAVPGPDLAITKSATPTEVAIGGEITYTIQVWNEGNAQANGVRVRDTSIDPELNVNAASLTTTRGECSFDARDNLSCKMMRLPVGEVVTINFSATAPEEACPFVRNQARVGAKNEPVENRTNNVTPHVKVKIMECPPDITPPSGSISINRGALTAWGSRVLLSLNATDDRTSRRHIRMRVSNSPALTADGRLVHATTESLASERRWSMTNPATGGTPVGGEKTVYVQFSDRAGNWSSAFSDSIRMRRDAANTCSGAKLQRRRPLNVAFREQIFPRADVDHFKFRLASRKDVTIRLGNLPLNYRLALLNNSCQRLAFSDNRGTGTEVIRRTLRAGTYVVRVGSTSVNLFSISPYALKISVP